MKNIILEKNITLELRKKLTESVRMNGAGGLLFSGGLDSSILAALNPGLKGITINLKSYGEDAGYASHAAKVLNLEHYHRSVDIDEAIEAIPEVIKALKTFDPAIPNDLAVYFGLKLAKERGLDEVMTGDGSDELFAGYGFMEDMDDLDGYIKRISSSMRFSSNELGEFFNIKIRQPYMDSEIMELALDIPAELKIRQKNGKIWGKWVLRKAFEDTLPKEIIWQDKRPLEYGSGMTELRGIISSRIRDEEFRENPYPVKFLNKEHFYYYKIYRNVIGEIPEPGKREKECPGCGAGMRSTAFHCKVCGYIYPIRKGGSTR